MAAVNNPLPEINVQPADVIRGPPEAYKNQSMPRGTCFIANWNKYDNELQERKGSRIDVESLERLFSQIGYWNVTIVEDLTKQELFSALEEFRTREISPQYDSFVGIFMSHGKENEIAMRDGDYVHVADIYDLFSGDKCPVLVDKPKIFIFQHCRGDRHTNLSSQLETDNTDGKSLGKVVESQGISDAYVIFSTRPRFVSYRNEWKGGAFIVEVCNVLKNHAKDKEICHLISLINNSLSKSESKQLCDLNLIGHKAQFYFNPLGGKSSNHSPLAMKGDLVKDFPSHVNTRAKDYSQKGAQDDISRSHHVEKVQSAVSDFTENFYLSPEFSDDDMTKLMPLDFGSDSPEDRINDSWSLTSDSSPSVFSHSFAMPQMYSEASDFKRDCRVYFINHLEGCKREVHELANLFVELGFHVDHLEGVATFQTLKQTIETLEGMTSCDTLVFYYGYGYSDYIFVGQDDKESISYKHLCNLFALNQGSDFDTVVFTNICFRNKASNTIVIPSPKEFVDNTYHMLVKVNGTCADGSLLTKALLEELRRDDPEQEFSTFTSCIGNKIKCLEESGVDSYFTSIWLYGVVRPFYFQYSQKSTEVMAKSTLTPDPVCEEIKPLYPEAAANERYEEQPPLIQKGHRRTLWEFLIALLCDDEANPRIIRWEDKDLHIFRIVEPPTVAKRWGTWHNMTHYQLRTFSRMCKFYHGKGIIDLLPGERYVYQCGPKAIERLNELANSKQELVNSVQRS